MNRKLGMSVGCGLAMLGACFGPVAQAQSMAEDSEHAAHAHQALQIDASLDWDQLLESALARNPLRYELAGLDEIASAWRGESSNLLAASPVINLSLLSDSSLDNRGQAEFEGGLDLPLWRLGQKDAARVVASSAADLGSATAAAMRLEMAGLLRSALWQILIAEQALDQTRAALGVTANLTATVETRSARGDLPLADVLLARASEYDRGLELVASQAAFVDAERFYASLTGLDARPADIREERSGKSDFDASHPLLAQALSDLERAEAELSYTDKARRGNPVLTLGPRRQRDPVGDFYNDSLAVSVSLPVGGRNHGQVERAEASGEVAAARSRLATVERELELAVHEAEHDLATIEESLALAGPQAELAEQRLQLSTTAFEHGEIDLQGLLRAQDAAIAARGAHARLELERQRAVAALNQALGELP